ncbi:MAG TPA: cysteine--tRNA ligase [Candidatus Polarisedimenticolaceae bacterium]|nr:cysteine--tRNA ligase [Candidatus Polarisedimenticolaceae bacterium]
MRVFNTLTRRVETLAPREPGHVRLYTCGPTVYDYAHIGNFRTYVWEDLLRRTLELLGFRVTQVMNITDIEDKIIARAIAEGTTIDRITAPFIDAFFADIETLGIRRAEHYPRATEHIPEMIAIAKALEARGLTYVSQGSLYFRIDAFPSYGRLSHLDKREIKVGARVDSDEYDKDDARDFVLWKAHRDGEPSWDSPFGPGRPGWHLECSAMSMKYLGESFDLHTGGVDNIFPHHENEIAQSEGATGRPFVACWMHAAHLMVDGEKMAKSKGNFHTLRDLVAAGHDPRAIRYLLLATHYRSSLNFTFDALARAAGELARFDALQARLAEGGIAEGREPEFDAKLAAIEAEVRDGLGDDLNVSGAFGALFRLVREANAALDRRELPAGSAAALSETLARLDGALGVIASKAPELLAPEIEDLIARRQAARRAKDFAESDRIRNLLAGRGIVLEDTPQGVRWRRSTTVPGRG